MLSHAMSHESLRSLHSQRSTLSSVPPLPLRSLLSLPCPQLKKSFEIGHLTNSQKILSFGFSKLPAVRCWPERAATTDHNDGVRFAPRAANKPLSKPDTRMGIAPWYGPQNAPVWILRLDARARLRSRLTVAKRSSGFSMRRNLGRFWESRRLRITTLIPRIERYEAVG